MEACCYKHFVTVTFCNAVGSGIKLKTHTKFYYLAVYLAICSLRTQQACNSLRTNIEKNKKLFLCNCAVKAKPKKILTENKALRPSSQTDFLKPGEKL